jgi:hypothetical protein
MDVDTLKLHGHGRIDMETLTWTDGHGHMETDKRKWKHGNGHMETHTWK